MSSSCGLWETSLKPVYLEHSAVAVPHGINKQPLIQKTTQAHSLTIIDTMPCQHFSTAHF